MAPPGSASDKLAERGPEELQGIWAVESIHYNGADFTNIWGNRARVFFGTRCISFDADETTTSIVATSAASSSKQIDYISLHTGKRTAQGVFALDGKTLRICSATDHRPDGFVTKLGDKRWLLTLKRISIMPTSRHSKFSDAMKEAKAALGKMHLETNMSVVAQQHMKAMACVRQALASVDDGVSAADIQKAKYLLCYFLYKQRDLVAASELAVATIKEPPDNEITKRLALIALSSRRELCSDALDKEHKSAAEAALRDVIEFITTHWPDDPLATRARRCLPKEND